MELMAPAGSFESLQAAIDNGADSVYFGIEQLNMRAKSSINFTLDDLPEIAQRCGAENVKTYLTLNTIIYDHDLSIIKKLVNGAKDAGITAIIASDQAVISPDGAQVLASASTLDKAVRGEISGATGNASAASIVGKFIAERAKSAGVESVAFDRSGFRYHGRVKALADAAREAGLQF